MKEYKTFKNKYILIEDRKDVYQPFYKEYTKTPELSIDTLTKYCCPFQKMKYTKPNKKKTKPGFCEVCYTRYNDYYTHVRQFEHMEFAKDSSNYKQIDSMISSTVFSISVCSSTMYNGTMCNGTMCNGTMCNGTMCNGSSTNGTMCNGTMCNGTICNGTICRTSGDRTNGTKCNGGNTCVNSDTNCTKCSNNSDTNCTTRSNNSDTNCNTTRNNSDTNCNTCVNTTSITNTNNTTTHTSSTTEQLYDNIIHISKMSTNSSYVESEEYRSTSSLLSNTTQ